MYFRMVSVERDRVPTNVCRMSLRGCAGYPAARHKTDVAGCAHMPLAVSVVLDAADGVIMASCTDCFHLVGGVGTPTMK